MGSGTIRIGGLCGLGAAGAIVPAYLAGSPEVPSDPSDAHTYFGSAASFLTANGTWPLLHILFTVLFVAILVSMLRSAAGPTGAVYTALIGGGAFLALTAAGLAAEVAVPAAIVRFDDVTVTDYSQPFLGLAVWLYHYSQMLLGSMDFRDRLYRVADQGAAEMVRGVGCARGAAAAAHLVGLPAAYSTVVSLGLTGLLMLTIPPVVTVESIGA